MALRQIPSTVSSRSLPYMTYIKPISEVVLRLLVDHRDITRDTPHLTVHLQALQEGASKEVDIYVLLTLRTIVLVVTGAHLPRHHRALSPRHRRAPLPRHHRAPSLLLTQGNINHRRRVPSSLLL